MRHREGPRLAQSYKARTQVTGNSCDLPAQAAFHQRGKYGTERGSDVPKAISQINCRARGRARARVPAARHSRPPDTCHLPGPSEAQRRKRRLRTEGQGTGQRPRSQATKRGGLTNQSLKAHQPPPQRGRSVDRVSRGPTRRDPEAMRVQFTGMNQTLASRASRSLTSAHL